jgi:glutathione-regulated potassium-efflux system protein KefB
MSLYQDSWKTALLIGLTMALSSTAMVMQMLQERGEIASRHGSAAFSILLMQDLAIVPLLALVPILSVTGTLSSSVPLWKQVGAVAGMLGLVWIFGRYVVPIALDRLSRQNNREAFFMVVMLAVFMAAWAMHQAGLSMALGAFMMGMLLSESRFSLQIEAMIEPYKGLMMSLFFVAVGMSIDLQAIGAQFGLFAQHTLVIIVIKLLALFFLALLFGLGRVDSSRVALMLAHGGEFGFVLFASARVLQVIDDATFVFMISIISVTMLATPLLVKVGDGIARRSEKPAPGFGDMDFPKDDEGGRARVIIGGYGRVGHTVAVLLHSSGVPFLAFDTNPANVEAGKVDGFPVFYGDIGDMDLMFAAGAQHAALVVLTIDHGDASLRAVSHIRANFPTLPVISRARDLKAVAELQEAGASHAVPDAIENSLRLAANALSMVGLPTEDVDQLLEDVRKEDYNLVR